MTTEKKAEEMRQTIKEIMKTAGRGCKVSHIELAQEAIKHCPNHVRESIPCLFGSVLYAGYVLGVRSERAKKRKNL